MKKCFYLSGILFFIIASLYLCVLIWKSYVWWNWLHRMEEHLTDPRMSTGLWTLSAPLDPYHAIPNPDTAL